MRVIPASSAAWMVAMLSARSAGPYMPDMPMQPRPRAEARGPALPSWRCCKATSNRPGSVRAGRRDEHRIGAIGLWKVALQLLDLRQVVDDDVGVARILRQKILMIGLGRIEGPAGLDGGDDRGVERMRLVELGDIGLGDLCLLRAGREDRRAILRAGVRPLAVELGRVMRDREIDLQDAAVADAAGIKGDL